MLCVIFQINQSGQERELSLDMDQFCEILSIVLNKGSREEYEDLFNKVDVGKEGYVDWDKFCSHMLLEYYEKDDRMKTTQVDNYSMFCLLYFAFSSFLFTLPAQSVHCNLGWEKHSE